MNKFLLSYPTSSIEKKTNEEILALSYFKLIDDCRNNINNCYYYRFVPLTIPSTVGSLRNRQTIYINSEKKISMKKKKQKEIKRQEIKIIDYSYNKSCVFYLENLS